jgi:glycosyltransferase involved in cell wall biosynthesis
MQMLSAGEAKTILAQNRICTIVPSYNNCGTVADVVSRLLEYSDSIIVVNDGSTDDTSRVLEGFKGRISVVSLSKNSGKGCALKAGFAEAIRQGFDYAITLDSDGQHFPEDIPLFVSAFLENKGALIVGSRNLNADNMPKKNTFANNFSNFWFLVQTWNNLPDTQTGYRLYPLHRIGGLKLLTSRYEAELEMLVFTAWRGVKLKPLPINVYYPPAEKRVSHFRPFVDFTRISILNTILCIFAILYGWPVTLYRRIFK